MTRSQFARYVESSQLAFRRFLTALCCGDSQLADDIAQEAYLKAYMACDKLEDDSKFNSWLYRIGYNSFISNRRTARFNVGYDEAYSLPSADFSDEAFRYQELHAALERLPNKELTSVLLYYMEGYSVKEITEVTGASQEAVRTHLSRGRNHLRSLLSKNENEYGQGY